MKPSPTSRSPAICLPDMLLNRSFVKTDPQLAYRHVVRTDHRYDNMVDFVAALAEEKVLFEIAAGRSARTLEFCQRHLPSQQLIIDDGS